MPETHQTTGYYGITGGMNIRQILARGVNKQAIGAVLAAETVIGFLCFTGHLDGETAARYAIAVPVALALLRAAWRIARP